MLRLTDTWIRNTPNGFCNERPNQHSKKSPSDPRKHVFALHESIRDLTYPLFRNIKNLALVNLVGVLLISHLVQKGSYFQRIIYAKKLEEEEEEESVRNFCTSCVDLHWLL